MVTANTFENNGEISSNGEPGGESSGHSGCGGGGSGGSIYIKAVTFVNKGKVIALGGAAGVGTGNICKKKPVAGGIGRIRVDYKYGDLGTIDPRPGYVLKLD